MANGSSSSVGAAVVTAASAAALKLRGATTATEAVQVLRSLSALQWGADLLQDAGGYEAFQLLYDEVGLAAGRSALAAQTAKELRRRWRALMDELGEGEVDDGRGYEPAAASRRASGAPSCVGQQRVTPRCPDHAVAASPASYQIEGLGARHARERLSGPSPKPCDPLDSPRSTSRPVATPARAVNGRGADAAEVPGGAAAPAAASSAAGLCLKNELSRRRKGAHGGQGGASQRSAAAPSAASAAAGLLSRLKAAPVAELAPEGASRRKRGREGAQKKGAEREALGSAGRSSSASSSSSSSSGSSSSSSSENEDEGPCEGAAAGQRAPKPAGAGADHARGAQRDAERPQAAPPPASASGDPSTLEECQADPRRHAVLCKLRQALGALGEQKDRNADALASDIEAELHRAFGSSERGYAQRARSVIFNLRDAGAGSFGRRLLRGEIAPSEVPRLQSEEMASAQVKAKRIQLRKECMEEVQTDWALKHGAAHVTGMFTCGKCGSSKTTYYQLQTRSADEPMTTFVTCFKCSKRWRC